MCINRILIALLILLMGRSAVGDSLVLVNGDDLNGQVVLLPEGRIELSHGILGKVNLDSKDVTAGQIKVTLSDGSVVSGLLVGWQSSAWIIKPVDEAPRGTRVRFAGGTAGSDFSSR